MKKLLSAFFVIALAVAGQADQSIEQAFILGSTGTTSATVVVKPGSAAANITDLVTRIDAGNVSATVDIRSGKARVPITSATAASLSQVWFSNTSPTLVAAQDYVLYFNAAAGTYSLLKCTASATTSITVQETISTTTTVNDFIFTLEARVRRPAFQPSSTVGPVNIWLPAGVASAIPLDGNTTSCQIEASGVRSQSK